MTHVPRDDAVHIDGVTKRFRATRAVDELNLVVARGSSTALLGPNGAGKTTTINMLLGLLAPDAGRISVLGATPRQAIAAGCVGAMLQDGGMLPGARVGELLRMLAAQYASPLDVATAIHLAQLDGIERRRVDRLSGGQSQRLRLALALVPNPDLLVLDEPTAAMDVEARRAFWAAMHDIATTGRTILFSTHYLEEADVNADRIVLMAQGRIVADGAPQHIKASLGTRVVRFSTSTPGGWDALPAVTGAVRRGDLVELHSTDSDATLRALFAACGDAHDIEVQGAGLEEAFITLTAAQRAA